MPIPSFHEWLRSADEALAADRLAFLIAQSGAAGLSQDDLARALRLPSETVESLLWALITARQVVLLKVDGEWRYRAAM